MPYDNGIGALIEVPAGKTHIGFWSVSDNKSLVPIDCALSPNGNDGSIVGDAPTNIEVTVDSFELMETEVSNQAYAVCVNAGACVAPDVPLRDMQGNALDWRAADLANQPVLVSWNLACAFCRHYGGNLPTAGEFSRAISGDEVSYATATLIDEWRNCWAGSTELECARMPNHSGWVGPLLDVGTDSMDLGAYGHHDLFNNAAEWLRGDPVIPNASSCDTRAESELALKNGEFNGDLVYIPVVSLQEFGPFPGGQFAPQYHALAAAGAPTGFRCAFPPK